MHPHHFLEGSSFSFSRAAHLSPSFSTSFTSPAISISCFHWIALQKHHSSWYVRSLCRSRWDAFVWFGAFIFISGTSMKKKALIVSLFLNTFSPETRAPRTAALRVYLLPLLPPPGSKWVLVDNLACGGDFHPQNEETFSPSYENKLSLNVWQCLLTAAPCFHSFVCLFFIQHK